MAETVIPQGRKAPAFTLLNQDNEKVSLKDYKGQWVVLYFYPKDLTPGCTTEAIDFSSLKKNFTKRDCVVLGVSPDPVEKHCKFIEKKELTIDLLSDPDHKIIEKYGAWQLKKFMGKEYMGVVRTTWLIAPDGKIAEVWSPVKVKNHGQIVLDKLEELQ